MANVKFIPKAVKIKFTAGRIADFKCADGKQQAFIWSAEDKGLGVRVTVNGAKSYIFQSKVNGQSIRVTIGDVSV